MGVFDGLVSSISASAFLLLILVLYRLSTGSGNAEGDALNAFKTQLSDPNSVLESWDPTLVNPCTWFNVTCNNQNTVIRVDLGNALLSGQLVPQLGQLVNLQYLELYSNNLSGSIPAELGNLTSLVSLDLYLNNLSGTIPSTLGNLQKLRSLWLSNNKLTGTIPMALTTIITLQVIGVQITGVSSDLLSLQKLRILDLSRNSLQSIPEGFKNFTSLTELDISDNNISALPPQLGLLKDSLQVLRLGGNPLRSINRTILDRGTKGVLIYLKDRIVDQ